MTTPNRTRSIFWLSYAAVLMTAVISVAVVCSGCGPQTAPTTDAEPCPATSTGEDLDASSGEPDAGHVPKFDVAAPDYCEAFAQEDPGFIITVTEDQTVISPTVCQGLFAECFISGVGTVDMWCDFPCGETRAITVDMPDEQGVYQVHFINPCSE